MSLRRPALLVVAATAAVLLPVTGASAVTAPTTSPGTRLPGLGNAVTSPTAPSGVKARAMALATSGAGQESAHRLSVLAAHGVTSAVLAAELSAAGLTVDRQISDLAAVVVEDSTGAAAVAAGLPGVASVQPVHSVRLAATTNDPYYANEQPYLDAIHASGAWDLTHGSSAVKIAIVDTGVETSHLDLDSKIVASYNATDGSSDVTDAIGHGTWVAGIAAAETNNAQGVAGTGYDSSIIAVKVADSSDGIFSDAIAQGVTWAADHGATVINLSLGDVVDDALVHDAVDYATRVGALVVAAAGNYGDQGNPVVYPAAYPSVLAVGGTSGATRASFSEYGSYVDVAAPATGIYGTTTSTGGEIGFTPNYDSGDGTSAAAPLVSGAAALLKAVAPQATAAQIRQALTSTASGYSGLGLGSGQILMDSAVTAITAPSTLPSITAPTDASSVAGHVQADATSTASRVRFDLVTGATTELSQSVPVSSGTATSTLDTFGLPNGSYALNAYDCNALDVCNLTGASVAVTVDNALPELTDPAGGATVSGTFTATATSPGGGVGFFRDGVLIGRDDTAPYQLPSYNITAIADGTHVLTARTCHIGWPSCTTGPVSPDTSVTFHSLHVTVPSVSPSPFSPNHDGVKDLAAITFSLPQSMSISVSITSPAGTVIRGPVSMGSLGAGSYHIAWDGMTNAGGRAANGTWVARVVGTLGSLSGVATHSVVLDVTPPALTSITGSGATFFPVRDGFRDVFSPTAVLSERAALSLRVYSPTGALAATVYGGTRNAGRQTLTWNGRHSDGSLFPAGTYAFAFFADDLAGNPHLSAKYPVTLSQKKIVARTASTTLSADTSYTGTIFAGDCSDVFNDNAYATGAFAYVSDAYVGDPNVACNPSAQDSDIVIVEHHVTLPSAVKYGSFTVKPYGRSDAFAPGSTMDMVYLDSDGFPSSSQCTLSATSGLHSCVTGPASLIHGRTISWWVGVNSGRAYDVKTYTIDYTYYVLV